MSLWNGIPTVRIAVGVFGRVLGVSDARQGCDRPPGPMLGIWNAIVDVDARWDRTIEGDFQVCALAPRRPGRMQSVVVTEFRDLSA